MKAKIQPYTVKKTIQGTEYTAQFCGISVALKCRDYGVSDNNNVSLEKLSEYILKNVIVEPPSLSIDNFESLDELNEVVEWATGVMNGNIKK